MAEDANEEAIKKIKNHIAKQDDDLYEGVQKRFLKFNSDGSYKGVDIDKFARYLINEYSFKTIYWEKSETIYLFHDGIWLNDGRKQIETMAEQKLLHFANRNVILEIVGKIKRQTAIDKDEFQKLPEGIICIENGLIDLRTGNLLHHSPEYNFKRRLPLTFVAEADCPKIKNFFSEALYEEHIPLMQEWFGFQLWNRYFEKKAVILHGDTDTGKTITMELLKAFLGEPNVSNLSLQKIGIGKSFDLLNLKDKYANLYDDLSPKDLKGNGFVIATGNSTIRGEVKFGDSINFNSFAKLTFSANVIPSIEDIQNEEAHYSRWFPIPYDNQIPKDKQDKRLLEKLTTKQELSGLLNWALEGLQRLRKNNGFSFNLSWIEVKEKMLRSGHPLAKFAQDCLIQADGEKITKDAMFAYYTKWCQDNMLPRMTKSKLGRNLEKHVPYIIADRSGKARYWLNVKLKPEICDIYDAFYKSIIREENKDSSIDIYISQKPVINVTNNISKEEPLKVTEELVEDEWKTWLKEHDYQDNDIEFVIRFGEPKRHKLLKDGDIFEHKPGWLKLL